MLLIWRNKYLFGSWILSLISICSLCFKILYFYLWPLSLVSILVPKLQDFTDKCSPLTFDVNFQLNNLIMM